MSSIRTVLLFDYTFCVCISVLIISDFRQDSFVYGNKKLKISPLATPRCSSGLLQYTFALRFCFQIRETEEKRAINNGLISSSKFLCLLVTKPSANVIYVRIVVVCLMNIWVKVLDPFTILFPFISRGWITSSRVISVKWILVDQSCRQLSKLDFVVKRWSVSSSILQLWCWPLASITITSDLALCSQDALGQSRFGAIWSYNLSFANKTSYKFAVTRSGATNDLREPCMVLCHEKSWLATIATPPYLVLWARKVMKQASSISKPHARHALIFSNLCLHAIRTHGKLKSKSHSGLRA